MANLLSFGITPGTINAGIGLDSNARTIEYVMTFDYPVDDTEEVLNVSQLPFPGYSFDFNETLKCTSVSIQPEESNHAIWRARAEFSATGVPIVEGYAYDFRPGYNPVEEVARGAYWYSRDTSAPAGVEELNDDPTIPIQNTAKDQFDNPLMKVTYNPVFSWWQVESDAVGDLIESGEIYDYIGTINAETISICGKEVAVGQAIIKRIEPELYSYRPPFSTQSEMRWKTSYTVEIAKKGNWVDSILDQGFQAYLRKSQSDATLVKRAIRLSDLDYNSGEVKQDAAEDDFVTTAQKLDGFGELLADEDDPVYLNYLVKPMKSWAGLDLAKTIATPDIMFGAE